MARRVDNFIKFPKNERETTIYLETFSEICKIPQDIGAIDATHTARDICILSPEREKSPVREKCLLFGRIQIVDSSHFFSRWG